MATKGWWAPGPSACSNRATSDFPVPGSPAIKTGAPVAEGPRQLEDLPPARVVADQAKLSGNPFDPVALSLPLGRPLSRRRGGSMHGDRCRRQGYSENSGGRHRRAGIRGLCQAGVDGQNPRLHAAFPFHRNRELGLDRRRGSRRRRCRTQAGSRPNWSARPAATRTARVPARPRLAAPPPGPGISAPPSRRASTPPWPDPGGVEEKAAPRGLLDACDGRRSGAPGHRCRRGPPRRVPGRCYSAPSGGRLPDRCWLLR